LLITIGFGVVEHIHKLEEHSLVVEVAAAAVVVVQVEHHRVMEHHKENHKEPEHYHKELAHRKVKVLQCQVEGKHLVGMEL